MPQAVEPSSVPPIRTFSTECEEDFPNRIRWTREECARLTEQGFLVGRYELIEGVIIRKMGQNLPHQIAITLLMAWLTANFDVLQVQLQLPINVAPEESAYNEPEPDGMVLSRPITAFTQKPGPGDVLLLIEISDTTLRFDRTTKLARYANAGFPEYWVLDINGRQLFVYRRPQADGTYAEEKTYSESESVAPLAKPEAAVTVASLLPPVSAAPVE